MFLISLSIIACSTAAENAAATAKAPSDDEVPAAPVPPAAPPAPEAGGPAGAAQANQLMGPPGSQGGGAGMAQQAIEIEPVFITNPASGSKIATYTMVPQAGAGPWPTLVIMPGGDHSAKENELKNGRVEPYHRAGFAVVMFDPEGRGNSEGKEDLNGEVGQDALAAVIRAAAADPRLDAKKMGLVSYSFGVAAATGVLARHPDLPIQFYIDWEGPVSRKYVSGCNNSAMNKPAMQQKLPFGDCSDEAWWKPREAVQNIGKVKVPYLRLQFAQDHVQKTYQHTVDMVQAAEKAGVDVRLNDMGKKPKIKDDGDIKTLDNGTPTVFIIAEKAVELMNETTKANMPKPPPSPVRRSNAPAGGPPGGGHGR